MAKVKPAADTPKCAISKADFLKHAKPLMITVGDRQIIASPKEFSTGSFGWYAGEKIVVIVNDIPLKVQIGMPATVVGSKGA